MVTLKGIHATAAEIDQMRAWITDSIGSWKDIEDEDDVANLTDDEVLAGINKAYETGLEGFLRDLDDAK